jgi:hypothetical protein
LPLPRYVLAKHLSSGLIGYYFNVPTQYRKHGCPVSSQPLGTNFIIACGADGDDGRAAVLNAQIDQWRALRPQRGDGCSRPRHGTVDWLFRKYVSSLAYTRRVSSRSRPDYERTMLLVTHSLTKGGNRIGNCSIRAITPIVADQLYTALLGGPNGPRPRQAEKAAALCRKAWRVVRRLYPEQFDRDIPNPWEGVVRERRTKRDKPAATRAQVYRFAWGCLDRGQWQAAVAAVACFEWLQRPENVLAGCLRWEDYRGHNFPGAIRIEHHKTGETIWHPLEEELEDEHGAPTKHLFYPEAEAVLARAPRFDRSMILYTPRRHKNRSSASRPKLCSPNWMAKVVRRMRNELGLPNSFTLDACRHGGMTELEEAGLTDGQGRALSGHRTRESYRGYAKRTLLRAISATRKRRQYVEAVSSRSFTSKTAKAAESTDQNDATEKSEKSL